MATQSLALSAPVICISHGQATTTSKAVADYFHKQHKNVLQKIEALKAELPPDCHELNFQPMGIKVEIGLGKTRTDPGYKITRDGFTLLAMGFTGKQALQWKLRYIEAFNAMEAHLNEQRALPADHVAISKADLENLREHLQAWREVSLRLYLPLSDLGSKDAAKLFSYAHEIKLRYGLMYRW